MQVLTGVLAEGGAGASHRGAPGRGLGFSRDNLTADSPLLLIAYYLYQREARPSLTSPRPHTVTTARRSAHGSSARSSSRASGAAVSTPRLTALRAAIIKTHGTNGWPSDELESEMARRGRGLRFEEEEIEDLLDVEYRDRRTFALLSLLYPYVDFRNVFHIDHVFPQSCFRKPVLVKAGVAAEAVDDFKDKMDRLANLQLLDGALNQAKSDSLPADWVATQFPTAAARAAYTERHDLGELPAELTRFPDFYAARRRLMRERLRNLLGALAAMTSPAARSGGAFRAVLR
jgi:hypothetical protein